MKEMLYIETSICDISQMKQMSREAVTSPRKDCWTMLHLADGISQGSAATDLRRGDTEFIAVCSSAFHLRMEQKNNY